MKSNNKTKKAAFSLWSFVAVFLFAMVFNANAAFAQGEALKLMKEKEKVVRSLLAKKTTEGTKEHDKKKEKLRETINELFDFKELAMRALDYHWEDITEAQRVDFVKTLQALIEKNYLMKITKKSSYQLKWYPELAEEDYVAVRFKIRSGKYKAAIQLRTLKKEGKIVVFDMLIDDVSLLENYRSQFNKIIRKDGFEKLLEKMKKKLEEEGDGKLDDDEDEKKTESEKK